MPENEITYLELPCENVAAMKTFYGSLFQWQFGDWGEDYAAFSKAGLDGGFNADPSHKPRAPLPIVETRTIEVMEERVRVAGGTITRPTFGFPGGRRFHFLDPAGNELAVMQMD